MTVSDIVPVKINVKKDAESYTVTPNNEVSVDKGEDVDPASLVTVTDPDGKQVQLPAGSIDWKDGAKPDLTTPGDKTGSVEVTFLDGSKKDTDVTIHVKTDAETYDPQAQPWTTTVGKTPKADEVISSTDKNGKKMPSDAKYTWKTEPDTSKTGEASGVVKVTYSDESQDEVPVTINVKDKLDDKEKYHIYGKDGLKVDKNGTLAPQDAIDVKDADGNKTTLPENSIVEWTKKPDFSQAGKDVTGEVTVTYPDPDHSKSDPVTVTVHVNGKSDEYKVAPRDGVTVPRGSQVDPERTVVAQTPDGQPASFPDGTTHKWVTPPDTSTTGNRTGVVETTFPDGSTTRTTVTVKVQPNQSDKYDPHGPENPDDRVPVKNPDHLTGGDKDNVKGEVGKVNPDLPKDTEVTVDDKGNATIIYSDGSKDKIPGGDLVRPEKDADKNDPKGPKNPDDRVPVKDPDHLTDGDKDKVKDEIGKENPDLPGTIDVDDKGNATITYPDGSKDTIPGGDLVRQEDKDKYDPKGPKSPDDRVPVKDPDHLTDGDKDKVKGEVGTVNPDLPKGTEVTVGDDGTATIKYPDGSKDKIPGGDLVRPENDADKYDPKGPKNPDDRVPVKDPEHLTKDDKDKVKDEVGKVNPDLPGTIDVDDKGNATITYPDGSKDTIPGGDLVRPENDADNITPNIPGDKVTVKDPSHLTDDEKNQVKNNVDNANKDKFPAGTVITVGDDGTATITYPDTSTDTIPGDKLVKGEDSGSTSGQTDAGNITPNIPGDKVTVKDPSHLTDDEKNQVKNNVDNANKDKFPAGTEVIVGNDGTATITYPDGSQDIIPGDQLVQGQKGDTTDAGNITPTIPGGKVTVKDPSHLTDDEKNQVKDNVDNANKDKFPAGTEVTVGDDGTATIKYPDGSQDTIPGDQLVQGQKGDTTDAGNITPTIP
ncbi:Rib/alpha-like domain-containing protein, partial [Lactobacillus crispatus]|uniref:Rib/alpha-like domain-containing protein n=1 Tax=Lactobacillus crispatus TaxID=47770 RepID=UPI00254ED258